jgi:hypothetical protein
VQVHRGPMVTLDIWPSELGRIGATARQSSPREVQEEVEMMVLLAAGREGDRCGRAMR